MPTAYLDNLIGKTWALSFKYKKTLMVYKSLNDLVIPGYLSSRFVKRYETRYSLRDSVNKLIVSFPRTNFMKTEQLQLQRSSSLEQPALWYERG